MSAPAPSELPSYRGYRYPAEIISHAVWLYFRFSLSLRDVEELLAERGVTVSYETMPGNPSPPHGLERWHEKGISCTLVWQKRVQRLKMELCVWPPERAILGQWRRPS